MVHSSAAEGYDGSAVSSYVAARPSYHRDAVARLARLLDGCERVVDLGAGAGILTAALADLGVEATAVEPVAVMRKRFAEQHPSIEYVDGTAECLPFGDGSIDAVVVGQAFHWFDHGPTLDELARVLRPGGIVALIWNVRDQSVEWVRRWSEIVTDPSGTTPRHHDMVWRQAVEGDLRFTSFEDWDIANPWPTTRQGVVDRALSVSYVGAMDEPDRAAIAQAVAELVADMDEPFDYPYRTELNIVRLGDPVFHQLGIDVGERLHGGFQSIVHAARWNDTAVVLKCELQPDPWLDARTRVVAAAAQANPQVVPPLEVDGALVQPLAGRRCVLHPFVAGPPPNIADVAQVEEMGRSLARLHAALRSLDGGDLPDVSALRALDDDEIDGADLMGEPQLIHADFGTSNLVASSDGLRILDFGELGFGTAALDVANTIFIERFSAALDGRLADADRFADVFTTAYNDEADLHLDSPAIEVGLQVRRRALGRWLDDPERAPVGIARAAPEWRRRLRRYAETDPADWGSID